MHEHALADLPLGDHRARLLHERIATVVERDDVREVRVARGFVELARFLHRRREGLVGDHVLAGAQRRQGDFAVQMIGRGVVHHVHGGVGQQFAVSRIGPAGVQLARPFLRGFEAGAGDADYLDVAQTTHGIEMMRGDEAGADESHAERHRTFFLALVEIDWLAMFSPDGLDAAENVFDYIRVGSGPEVRLLRGVRCFPQATCG